MADNRHSFFNSAPVGPPPPPPPPPPRSPIPRGSQPTARGTPMVSGSHPAPSPIPRGYEPPPLGTSMVSPQTMGSPLRLSINIGSPTSPSVEMSINLTLPCRISINIKGGGGGAPRVSNSQPPDSYRGGSVHFNFSQNAHHMFDERPPSYQLVNHLPTTHERVLYSSLEQHAEDSFKPGSEEAPHKPGSEEASGEPGLDEGSGKPGLEEGSGKPDPYMCGECEEEILEEDDAVVILKCGHKYHACCIVEWQKKYCFVCEDIALNQAAD